MASYGPFFKLPRNCLDFEHNLTCAFLQKKKPIAQSCFLLLITVWKTEELEKSLLPCTLTVFSLSGNNR